MQTHYRTSPAAAQDVAAQLSHQLESYLGALLVWLDCHLDKRLLRTFLNVVAVIIIFRERAHGLLLSELGAYLAPRAPAGTKRLSNLIHSPKWSAKFISFFLWFEATLQLGVLERTADLPLLIWDESALEKPESIALEGLCAVRSSKAQRLTRLKPGYYQPPKGKVFVPGQHWLSLVLVGLRGRAHLAAMHWWTTRGKAATDARSVAAAMLAQVAAAWGKRVVHIFDRGYAGEHWLRILCDYHLRFVLRWPKRYRLQSSDLYLASAWKLLRGKRSWESRPLWDSHHQLWRNCAVVATPVLHPNIPYPLWLVAARLGKGHEPWYLLTNLEVNDAAQAWQIVLMYQRRWQIEMSYRYLKSELGLQSVRLWSWESREKLLMIASLAYAFLLTLLDADNEAVQAWLLDNYCARTGQRSRKVAAPLYRLRAALSKLWLAYPPQLDLVVALNSG